MHCVRCSCHTVTLARHPSNYPTPLMCPPGVSGLTSGYQSDTSSVIQGQDTLSSPETPLGHHARPTGANRDLQRADTGNSGGGASPKRATEGAPARGGEVETRARATSPPALGTTAGAGNHAPVVTEEDVERWREQARGVGC